MADEKRYSCNEEMFFEVSSHHVRFSVTDLALITWLKCHGETNQKK